MNEYECALENKQKLLHLHLLHQLKDVSLLHSVQPELLQLIPATAEELLARVQVLLDRVDALPGGGDMSGDGGKQLHDLRKVTIVLGDEFVQHLVGLLELPFDLLLLLLALLIGLAGVQGLDHGDEEAATSLWGLEGNGRL